MTSMQNFQRQSLVGEPMRSRWQQWAGVAIGAIGAVVMLPTITQAQVTEAEMQSFPMPPTRGYINKAEPVDVFVSSARRPAYIPSPLTIPSIASIAENFEYVRYTDIQGKKLLLFGFPAIYRPTGSEIDLCSGTTFTTGTWIKYRQVGFTGPSSISWRFIRGSSGNGVRSAAYRGACGLEGGWRTKGGLSPFDFRAPVPLFGWVAEEVVIGNLQLSRNGGGCGAPKCYMPSTYRRQLIES